MKVLSFFYGVGTKKFEPHGHKLEMGQYSNRDDNQNHHNNRQL